MFTCVATLAGEQPLQKHLRCLPDATLPPIADAPRRTLRRCAATVDTVCAAGHTDRVWQVSWSPSGNELASCSGDSTVRIVSSDWRSLQARVRLTLTHTSGVRSGREMPRAPGRGSLS